MSDPSDVDKIRGKRLAMLQNQAKQESRLDGDDAASDRRITSTDPSLNSSRSSEQPSAMAEANSNSGATASPPIAENPFAQLGVAPIQAERKIRITPTSASGEPRGRHDGVSLVPSSRHGISPKRTGSAASAVSDALELWEDRTLASIFRVTLDPQLESDARAHPLHVLPGTRVELEEQGSRLRLNRSVLDQAILEAASNQKDMKPLAYLLGCWKRVMKAFRGLRSPSRDDPKYAILHEAKRLCMSYCIFAATLPEMFGLNAQTSNPLTTHLLADPEDDRGICPDFLAEAVRRFDEDDSIREALVEAAEEISRRLADMTMNDDYKSYMALRSLIHYPPLVDALTRRPSFLGDRIAANEIEHDTLLGPFFRISPLQGPVTMNYFSSPKTRSKGHIATSQSALRLTLQTHQSDLLDIVNHIVRASKASREAILNWFALIVNANHKRRSLQVDHERVSSDAFMINVTVCLDQLCDPFMDTTFSKMDRIDVDYLRRKPRVDISDETKLNADQQASDRFYSTTVDGTSNFISEIFFLTLAAHRYGTEATITKLEQLEKDLKHMEKQLQRLEAEREKWINTPQLQVLDLNLNRYREAVDRGLCYRYSIEGVLYDDLSQTRSMQFMRYVIVWMLRLVAPRHNYPAEGIVLPLPKEPPDVFKCLPEYFLEDVVGTFKFIFRHLPHDITATQSEELVTLCIVFLRNSEYIKNPYLKSGLVSLLFYGVWRIDRRPRGVLGDLLSSLPFATEHLMHALLKFYIEVENTGAHTQFYDKFNIRYEIFQVIKCIWSNPIYREKLSLEAKQNVDFFVRFVNLLLNDVTFVLDESLTAFGKIHRLLMELEDRSLEAQERSEKEEQLATSESMAKNYMQLTNETVSMLKLFTGALADSFTMPEIVQRLADMLDYNIDAMVGPKSISLKVRQPEQYGFRPRVLLSEIVDVFLNLRDKRAFIEAVARDGRSYKPANFDHVSAILSKWRLKSSEDLTAWAGLAEQIKQAKEIDDQAEFDLGEIPDDFLDPLMFSLMEDPVILPASKISIDRSTIRSHLLSDPHDPFNRVPLTIEDVRPDVELKAKIEAFKAERTGKKVDSDPMDTSGD